MTRLPIDLKTLRSMPVESLITFAELLATTHHDGHLVIYRMTTAWKVLFVGPCSVTSDHLENVPPSKTLRAALQHAITAELGTAK
jgi:hypothetical protein